MLELDISRKREDVPYSGNEDNKDHHTKRVAIKLSKKVNSISWNGNLSIKKKDVGGMNAEIGQNNKNRKRII